MSVQIALDNIWLRNAARWGHTEYSLEYHEKYLAKKTGLTKENPAFLKEAYDTFIFDLRWNSNDGLINWEDAGRITNMGHASYATDDSDMRIAKESPFRSEEDVWSFDAVAEYGLPNLEEQVKAYEEEVQRNRRLYPNQLTTGGYYKTIVSGAIASFGWEAFLLAATNTAKLEKVLDSFYRRSRYYLEAWAKTSVEVIIQHDDFVWTSGPFLHQDVYQKIIIPRYAALWKVVHDAGKKVLFCSDGNFMSLAEDVAAAGADGFIFEPCNDFGFMVDHFRKNRCLVGGFVDCRDLTFEKWDKVRQDIDKTLAKLSDCKGALVAVGNHLPPNIPDHMLDKYFDYLLPRLSRS